MTRTYVPIDPATKPRMMTLTCSHCTAALRARVAPTPDGWPQHRCGGLAGVVRPFDYGEADA